MSDFYTVYTAEKLFCVGTNVYILKKNLFKSFKINTDLITISYSVQYTHFV